MAEKQKERLKGDALVNKVALIIIEVINISLILGFVTDYLAGISPLSYFLAFEAAAIITFILVPVFYVKKPDKMRYVAFYCFAVVYLIGILGAHVDVAFVMAFPIVVVFILYYDYKLMKTMAITFGVMCVIDCLYVLVVLKAQHSGLPINSSILLMEFLGTVVYLIAAAVATKISIENNTTKLNTIKAVSDKVNESIVGINSDLNQLNEASESVKNAMEEINTGITSTAEAVQEQLMQTEAIQERIENVQQAAGNISGNVETTMGAVETGTQDVAKLVAQADESVKISEKVTADLNNLKKSVEAMGAITKMIDSITFQTNIMALNANVEAAHAGEAGRGFAVVASEISNMSTKTKEATDNITDLINNATDSLNDLVASINDMADIIRSEKAQTEQTSQIFASIQKNTEEVSANVDLFMNYINGLTEANRQIVQSVQTISATTEQVTALTNEAYNREQNNAAAVANIAKQVEALAKNNDK